MLGVIIGFAIILLILIIIITDGFHFKKRYTPKSDEIGVSEGKVFFDEEKIGFIIEEGYKLIEKRSVERGNLYDKKVAYDGLYLKFSSSDNNFVTVYIKKCKSREEYDFLSRKEKKDKPHCISRDVRTNQKDIYECFRNSTSVVFLIYSKEHYIVIRYTWRFYPFGIRYDIMSPIHKNNLKINEKNYMFAKNIMNSIFLEKDM